MRPYQLCTPRGPYGRTQVDDGLKADVVAMTWCYPALTGSEVSFCVGGVVKRPWTICVHFGLGEAVCFNWD